ncbi:MAG: response regulator transcription factor [Chloroflexota bacterium]
MSRSTKILIVDDEPAIRETLAELLNTEGRNVMTAASGEEALALLHKEDFDLMLLDLVMPGMGGLQVMEKGRKIAPQTVIIMLTAHGTLSSAIQAMRQGAHDYLLKPASAPAIMASVEEGLRRRQETLRKQQLVQQMERAIKELSSGEFSMPETEPQPERPARFLRASDIVVDLQRQIVLVRDEPVNLTPTELRLLTTLMQRPNEVVSAHRLVQEVQGYECDELEARAIIRVHIRRLRKKIEESPEEPRYVVNVRGVGYMFASGE